MRLLDKTSAVVLSIAVGVGITYAQAPDATPPASGSADVTGSLSVGVKLSVSEMSARAASLEAQANADYRHVLHLQAVARKDKDVIKLNCINDKLVQLKAQLNIFGSFYGQLTAALGTDSDERHQVFVEVSTAGDSVKRLRTEAEICAGEVDLKIESSALVDRPDIPDDPTTWDPNWEPDVVGDVEPPGYASPYR